MYLINSTIWWQILKNICVIALLVATIFNTSCNEQDNKPNPSTGSIDLNMVRLKTVYGDIIIQLDFKNAPLTTARIKYLVSNGFYSGLDFHKVIPDYIIQTGDPTGTGNGGSGKLLKTELNNLIHQPGSVSIVRNKDIKNSADSQFFICLNECTELNGKYTVFGQVIEGLGVAKKIQREDKIINLSLE